MAANRSGLWEASRFGLADVGIVKMLDAIFNAFSQNGGACGLADSRLHLATDITVLCKYFTRKGVAIGMDAFHHLRAHFGAILQMHAHGS